MPSKRIPDDQIRICTTVDRGTHKTLRMLAGRRTIIEGHNVSLAEYVRRLLRNAPIYDKSALDDTELNNRLSALATTQTQ